MRKKSERQFMVDVSCFSFADSAQAIGCFNRFFSCRLPPNTATFWFSTTITGMMMTAVCIGLPFRHANASAKNVFGMKVRISPIKGFTTPTTIFLASVARASLVSLGIFATTFHRAILPRSICRLKSLRANWTDFQDRWTKAMHRITASVTKQSAFFLALIRERFSALFTIHISIFIDGRVFFNALIEKETEYFDIAKARIKHAQGPLFATAEYGVAETKP